MTTRAYWKNGRQNFYDDGVNTTFKTGVWANCPLTAMACDPTVAYEIFDDFLYTSDTELGELYTATQATTGTFALDTSNPAGVALADSASGNATEGINVQLTSTLPFKPAATKDIWFECRVKVVDTYDKAELFIGLAAADTTIIATSANSSANHIGWQCVTDDGVLLFTSEKAGTGTTSAAATIAEATYIRLGFHVSGVSTVQQYINGVAVGDPHETANIPIVGVTPSFVCQSGGTNDPILHIDWYRCVQLR